MARRILEKPNLGMTGQMAEYDVLSQVTRPESYEEWEKHQHLTFLRFADALATVKKLQPENLDSQDPWLPFPNKVFCAITEKLEISWKNLRYFTCVHFGELDYRRGIDAIFEWTLEDGQTITVSLDLKLDPNRKSKADVVVIWPKEGLDPSLPEDREEHKRLVEETAEEITQHFIRWQKIKKPTRNRGENE